MNVQTSQFDKEKHPNINLVDYANTTVNFPPGFTLDESEPDKIKERIAPILDGTLNPVAFSNMIKDTGERSKYDSGAVRDNHDGKGRFDLLATQGIFRYARWMELGAGKYEPRNWEKGMPTSRYVDATLRHMFKYLAGCNDEDHLAAAMWNIAAIMYNEEKLPEMQDLPEWKNKQSRFVIRLDKE